LVLASIAVALLAPGTALAASKPTVATRAPSLITPSTAQLNGRVTPNGAPSGWFFQFGTTRLYGGQTPEQTAQPGSGAVPVSAGVTGLAPATTYHYRLVARNSEGLTLGPDRTFKTRRQPLGVTLAANPSPARTDGATTLFGTLTGTGNAGRQVVLQANPYPYTQGFVNAANPQVTDAQGNFSFPILSVPVNTQYRVLMPTRPDVVSPIVFVGTYVRVTTHAKVVRRFEHSGKVRFSGSMEPAVDGSRVLIQKFWRQKWTTVGRTVARAASGDTSRYRKTIRQRKGGRYRVVVDAQGAHTTSFGHTKRVRHVRR